MNDPDAFVLTRPRNYLESGLQRSVVNFLRWSLPANATFFSIPNTGFASKKVTGRLIGEGLRAGVPDLEIIHDGDPVFLELKTATGSLSAVQRAMHRKLADCGAAVHVCRSLPDVQAVLLEAGVALRGRLG